MRAISLGYHNVVKRNDRKSNEISDSVPSRYAIEVEEFASHLAAIAEVRATSPSSALELDRAQGQELPLLLTFDDGELGAYTYIADHLERYNWRGHFFIPTNYIGAPRFMTSRQIRELSGRGHIIGSHSCSHPHRMARCDRKSLIEEWTGSAKILSDLIGEAVTVASVPGGEYSRKVAEAASAAGIKVLFNSEPVTRCHTVDECMVLGRYSIFGGMPVRTAAGLAGGQQAPRLKQFFYWNLKKSARFFGANVYTGLRARVLERESRAERRLESPSEINS
jgi:peptidoglycan/xylan/chitin deacetylase (PgdA/CDA1 family)